MYGWLEMHRNLQRACQGLAVICRHLTAEVIDRFWDDVCGVCGGKCDSGTQ